MLNKTRSCQKQDYAFANAKLGCWNEFKLVERNSKVANINGYDWKMIAKLILVQNMKEIVMNHEPQELKLHQTTEGFGWANYTTYTVIVNSTII